MFAFQHRLAPASLQINYGYARTAIRELSSSKRGNTRKQNDKQKRSQDFQAIFDIPTLILQMNCLSHTAVPPHALTISVSVLFCKENHRTIKRLEYIDTFSISKWRDLPSSSKEHHSLGNCSACYNTHLSLQEAYPGKPIHEPHTLVRLPSLTTESEQARSVLAELNPIWQN